MVVVLLANATFFLVLLCFVTDPFEKLPHSVALSDGAGLNPLLQHPVMMIHPVMLYTGLVGFVINGAMLLLVALVSDQFKLGFHIGTFPPSLNADAVVGAIAAAFVISVVSTLLGILNKGRKIVA